MSADHPENPDAWTGDPLERLVAECIERMSQEGPGVLEDVAAANPDHAEALRGRLKLAQEMGLLGEPLSREQPRRLADFELFERLGGGGMGFVYRARQERLGRDVAVKIIRPEYLHSSTARERFRREARAVARLQHPGIVQLFSVGEEDGTPFIAMELVEGQPLSEVLAALEKSGLAGVDGRSLRRAIGTVKEQAEGSGGSSAHGAVFRGSWVDACLQLVRQVAEALEHAHARGVVHRDVKPSNLVLTPSGRVLLLDFGLARDAEQSRMTATASELGSLPYMAPEILLGKPGRQEALADIYGLGVTLYEMLALRLPFSGTGREHTRSLIIDSRAPALRKLNPAVSWEVETVCARAMDRDPEQRYPTAADFARDLGNVLDGRSIEARRPGILRRVRSQYRRRPAATMAVALAIGLFVVAPILHAWRQSILIDEARVAQRKAEALNTLTQETTGFLWNVVNTADAWTWMRRGLKDPEYLEVQARAIMERCKDRELRAQLARTLAITCMELGLDGVGEDLARVAMKELAGMEEFREIRRRLASQYASLLCRQGRYDEAEVVATEVIRDFEESGDPPTISLALALAHHGEVLLKGGELTAALPLQERALELMEKVAPERRSRIVAHQSRLGMNHLRLRRFQRAEELCRQAVEGCKDISDADLEARIRAQLVAVLRGRGRNREALQEGEAALSLLRRVHPPGHVALLEQEMTIAKLHFNLGQRKKARPGLDAAWQRRKELLPAGTAEAVAMLAACIEKEGNLDRARELLLEAVRLNDSAPGEWRRQGAHYRHHLGRVLANLDELEEALAHCEEAARLVESLAPQRISFAWRVHHQVASLRKRLGDDAGSARGLLKVARTRGKLSESIRLARDAGDALHKLGVSSEAVEAWSLAVAMIEKAPEEARKGLLQELTDLRARIDQAK